MKKLGSHVVVVQAFTRRLDLTLRTYPFQRQQLTIRKEHGSGPFQKLFQRGHRPTGNHVKGVIAVLGAQSLHLHSLTQVEFLYCKQQKIVTPQKGLQEGYPKVVSAQRQRNSG